MNDKITNWNDFKELIFEFLKKISLSDSQGNGNFKKIEFFTEQLKLISDVEEFGMGEEDNQFTETEKIARIAVFILYELKQNNQVGEEKDYFLKEIIEKTLILEECIKNNEFLSCLLASTCENNYPETEELLLKIFDSKKNEINLHEVNSIDLQNPASTCGYRQQSPKM